MTARRALIGVVGLAAVALPAAALPAVGAAPPRPPRPPMTDVRTLSSATRASAPQGSPLVPSARPSAGSTAAPGVLVRDVIAAAGQPPGLFRQGATEPSIAVDPNNPSHIAVTAFYDFWFDSSSAPGRRRASLFYSADGGRSWSRQDTIPAGPGVVSLASTFGPCDQTVDYGNHHQLAGTFLICTQDSTYVITGQTTDPTRASAWSWCADGSPSCPALPEPTASMDQPQLLVNRDPAAPAKDNVYVAYDDFVSLPGGAFGSVSHVAVAGGSPLRFQRDQVAGNAKPLATNPGLRIGKDPRSGALYALYERSATTGARAKKIVTYQLNRSTDGGRTWALNGNPSGIPIATTLSEQAPYYKFCNANALLGGVDALSVDPRNGDVYVAYGNDRTDGVGNEIYLKRVRTDAGGVAHVGTPAPVPGATNAALPSVAVTAKGEVGVLFDTCEDATATYPRFAAHLARSQDGSSFSDDVLSRFSSSVQPDPRDPRQRVLGDYQQLKATGNAFYGVFSGNRAAVGGSTSTIDPIFFRAP